jgi:hypothetical protein
MARVLTPRIGLPLGGALLLAGCSVLYGSPPAEQCSSDADCERQPALRGLICDQQYGICVSKAESAAPAPGGCESSELCTERNEGAPSLCRVPGTPCIPLTTDDCSLVRGRWEAPNSLLIGSIGPHTLRQVSGNAVPVAWTSRAAQALDLGLSEWNELLPNGLLTSSSSLAIVHCDSGGDPARIARAVDHLTSTVRVRALIALGDVDGNASADPARESDIPVVCAGCYERAQGAFPLGVGSWRVQPPLEDQAPLVARRMRDLEQQLRSERSLPEGASIRVALVGQDSPGNEAFVGAVRGVLRFNRDLTVEGQSDTSYLQIITPNPTLQNLDALGVSQRLVDFRPDVLIAGMDSDFAAVYLSLVEKQWPAETPRPFYILSMQNRELGLLETLGRESDDLHLRVSGTAPLSSAAVAQNRDGFAGRFLNAYGERAGETQSAYDAFYATAYAFFVADRDRQYVTARFAYGIEQLTQGSRINVGPNDFLPAGSYLKEEESINLVGSSSELDWDLSSGGITTDAAVWCLSRDAGGALQVHDDAGVHWSRATGEVTGTYACPQPTPP